MEIDCSECAKALRDYRETGKRDRALKLDEEKRNYLEYVERKKHEKGGEYDPYYEDFDLSIKTVIAGVIITSAWVGAYETFGTPSNSSVTFFGKSEVVNDIWSIASSGHPLGALLLTGRLIQKHTCPSLRDKIDTKLAAELVTIVNNKIMKSESYKKGDHIKLEGGCTVRVFDKEIGDFEIAGCE